MLPASLPITTTKETMVASLRRQMLFTTLPIFTALTLLTSQLYAQASGRITGQVLDTTQAAMPQVKVAAENVANGQKRQVQADGTGRYAIVDLPVGTYHVKAERSGFRTQVFTNVVVNVATTVTVDFVLPVEQFTLQVRVTAPRTDTTGASTGGVMENQQIIQLPINGRDYARFSLLLPAPLPALILSRISPLMGSTRFTTSSRLMALMHRVWISRIWPMVLNVERAC